ncbi:MAG: response regulator [Planctomycetes bacterium]|nr:response regulator [Planctomycetota bacterium]
MSRHSDLANLSGIGALQSPLHATQATPGEVDASKSARRFGSCETNSSGLLLAATESKKLEEELLQAHKAEAVGMLAGGIAHDFNTLLTAIFGWLEIAGSELPAEHSARDALRMAEKAARQAMGLTRSLLTISHRAPTEMQRIRLDEVVEESVRLLARLLPASIEQRMELPEETVWIDGDPTQVQQVLMNLAVNARDAMPDGGTLWIKLETRPRTDVPKAAQCESFSGGVAVLSVRDSGCGLSPDVEARALEPFFTTKSRERGTGLGLSIVQAIVTSHGGWIDIDSEVDRGSTFTVYLPRKEPAAMPAEAEPCRQLEETAPPACVLVVEDNDLVRAMLATILTDAGHSVREAADGEEAIRILTEHADEIGLAIVDLDLPKVNGVSVLTTASKLSSRLRGIGITGFPINDATRKRIEDLGYPVLNKPFQVHAIKELVAQLLKK